MDTSETYIKMCEKAEEIQREWPQAWGDFYYTYEGEDAGPGISHLYRHIWLPRQDQLQEMVNCRTASDYSRWAYKLLAPSEWLWEYEGDWSVEQLWLAFVMKEKHGKRWNGEDWIKEPS